MDVASPFSPSPEPVRSGANVGVDQASLSVRPPWAGQGARRRGRYRLGPLLGRGGMGDVREAWDTLLNRRVALKSLTVASPTAILRFMQEAQLQARVTHPNVCRIYDVDAAGDVPFIAMQLVQGPSLFQAAPALSVAEAVEILHAVATAINAAHRLSLIHRDIKPSNILLEPDGMGGWRTFVADFGLAKDLAEKELTQGQGVMGTPDYMAPEQQRGDQGAIGPAVDIYALGATLRTVLELRQAGPDASGRGGGTLVRPNAWRGIPGPLRTVIRKCLEERPQDRYPSAGVLAEDLRRFLDGEPLLAQRRSGFQVLGRMVRRQPALSLCLGGFLLLGVGFGVWSRRVAARNQRQIGMAQRFALDARDLENRMRIERLIPVHDLRPAMAQMARCLEQIQADLARLGPEAQGPGRLALGRGYWALGRLEQAQAALEEAWRGGFATPEVAYALCKVHTDFCLRLAEGGPAGDPDQPLEGLRATHLRAARFFFNQARGEDWEPLELGEAGLLVQEGAYAAALARAKRVYHEAPWRYEARVEAARALEGLGLAQLDQGRAKAALSLFREASLAARAAQAIGQSDEACYLADWSWRFHWLERTRSGAGATLAALDEMEPLANRLLAIRPDSPEAVQAKAYVMLRRASVRAETGADPEPDLRRAERYLAPYAQVPALERLVLVNDRWIRCVRAEFRIGRGEGPGTTLDWALTERDGGIWRLAALILEARWQVRAGRDPGPWLQAFWAHGTAGLGPGDRSRQQALETEARLLGVRGSRRQAP